MKFFAATEHNLGFVRMIYKISSTMGITPYYDFENERLTARNLRKIQSVFAVGLILFGTMHNLYVRYRHFTSVFSLTRLVLDVVCEIFLVGTSLAALINKDKVWLGLSRRLGSMRAMFCKTNVKMIYFWKNMYFYFVCYIAFNFGGIAYMYCIWFKKVGAIIYLTHGVHLVCALYDGILHFLILTLTFILTCTYKKLNKSFEISPINSGNRLWNKDQRTFMRKMYVISKNLAECVEAFNVIFGWPLILMIGKNITQILTSFNYMIGEVAEYDATLNKEFFIGNILLGAYALMATATIMVSCDTVVCESRRTVFLCYRLQEYFFENSTLRADLYVLARHLKVNVIKITAANFFDISKSSLFGIFSTITTYIIILLQFSGVVQ